MAPDLVVHPLQYFTADKNQWPQLACSQGTRLHIVMDIWLLLKEQP